MKGLRLRSHENVYEFLARHRGLFGRTARITVAYGEPAAGPRPIKPIIPQQVPVVPGRNGSKATGGGQRSRSIQGGGRMGLPDVGPLTSDDLRIMGQ